MRSLLPILALFCGILVLELNSVNGHGMSVNPIHRGSRWRCDKTAPPNYDDDGLYCGGFGIQWGVNEGKCGICGDDWQDRLPRPHEHGGKYGKGVIVKNYVKGSLIDVDILLTANHWGYFTFDLCKLEGSETDACFEQNKLMTAKGELKWKVPSRESKVYTITLQLPKNLECKHCVLRWTYTAGNNWGTCEDGSEGMGCGPQEHFRSCSDISISSQKSTRNEPNWNDICAKQKGFIEDIVEEFRLKRLNVV